MAPADRRFGIALLEEVLEAFPGVVLNLDIKQTAPAVEPYEAELAELLRRFGRTDATSSWPRSSTRPPTPSRPSPRRSRRRPGPWPSADFFQAVQCRRGPRPPCATLPSRSRAVGEITLVDAAFVDVAHRMGLAVHVWTIEEESEMEELCGLGVDGIITDRPSALVGVLDGLGLRGAGGGRRVTSDQEPGEASAGLDGRHRRSCVDQPGQEGDAGRPSAGSGSASAAVRLLPWLAFFLARSLRLLVRFDTARPG